LYYKTWRPTAVWEHMPIRDWIGMLDASTETMSAYDSTTGMEPRSLGWGSPAQAQGYTTTHPLDEVFPAPLTVYRQDDDLRDWVEQVEAQERRVAEGVAQVAATTGPDLSVERAAYGAYHSSKGIPVEPNEGNEGEKRHLLNVLFPMSRKACSYPSECAFTRVCYGGEDIRRDPLASGLYRARVPNHPAEAGGGASQEEE
jgi:hypothetical protein